MENDEMKMVGTRIPTNLKEELDDYCDNLGIRHSEGIRRLLQDALEDETTPGMSPLSAMFILVGVGILLGVTIQRTEPGAAVLTGVSCVVVGVLAQAAVTARARADN